MSARNLFVLKSNNPIDTKRIYDAVDAYMQPKIYSVVFEPKCYWDEILNCLDCKCNYFTLTEDKKYIECEDIFSIEDAFVYARRFPRKQFRDKEHEFLQHKLSFFNDVVNIIFQDRNVETVEIYISDQYSTSLDDFKNCIPVNDRDLTKALIGTFESTKREKYFGMKTVKFIIERSKND